MEIIKNIPFAFDSEALLRRNHIQPGSDDAAEFEDLLHLARQIGKPKAVFAEAFVSFQDQNIVFLNEIRFNSAMLRLNLLSVERVFAFVATCGLEMDEVDWADGNMLKLYWWDTVKESLLVSAIKFMEDFLRHRYLLTKTSTMNPGSGDVDVWPIEQQRELFALLGDVRKQIGVELTDSFLMIPNKTVSGIIFPTESDFRTCQVCRRKNCPSRRAPFDQILWDSVHSNARLPSANPTEVK